MQDRILGPKNILVSNVGKFEGAYIIEVWKGTGNKQESGDNKCHEKGNKEIKSEGERVAILHNIVNRNKMV